MILGLRRGGDRRQGATVKSSLKRDDFPFLRTVAFTGPLAGQFDQRFIGLGAGVAEEDFLGKRRSVDQFPGQVQRRFVIEQIADMPDLADLPGDGGH